MRTSKVLLTIALLSNLFAIPAFAGETLESSYKGDDYLMFARVSGKPADNDATHIEFRRLQKAYLSGSTTTTVQPTSVIPNTNNSDTEQVTVPVVQPTKPNQPKPRVKTRKPNKPGYTINHGNKKIKIMFIFN